MAKSVPQRRNGIAGTYFFKQVINKCHHCVGTNL